MRSMWRAVAGVVAVGLMAARPAAGQVVVYDGGAPLSMGGGYIGQGLRPAQGFTLGASTTFDAVRFWGLTSNDGDVAYVGPISYAFYTQASGGTALGTLITGGTVSLTGGDLRARNIQGGDSYRYTFNVGSLTLGAGSYFLELSGGRGVDFMGWEITAPRSDASLYGGGPTSSDNAFQLVATSTVPEPSTWALMGTGLLALGGVAARRRRTS